MTVAELKANHEQKYGVPWVQITLPDSQPRTLGRAMIEAKFTRDERRTLRHWRGTFYEHNGTAYTALVKEKVRADVAGFTEQQIVTTDNGDEALYATNRRRIDDVMDALATLSQVDVKQMPAWLDNKGRPDARAVIPFQNGLLDVAKWLENPSHRLSPSTPMWFSTNVLPFNFDASAPEPATWWDFMSQLWEDPAAIDLLQEWFGLCLTSNTSLQKILLLVGPTRSGKGTIARVLKSLIGEANVCGPTMGGLASHFGLWSLVDKQLAILSDVRMSHRADQAAVVELLLMISGEDGVTIDRKNMEPITVTLPTRLMVISNELPRLADASGALADRFVVLTLKQSFLGREDTELTAKLTAELPGIAVWALEGLRRLMTTKRFTVPESSVQAVEELQDLTSPIKAFIRERCTVAAGKEATVATLYGSWVAWCKEQGRDHPGTSATFGRDLRAAVPGIEVKQKREDGGHVRIYEGIDVA